MRRVLIIGIGSGDPDHLTLQAVKALQQVDVIFTIDKGPEKATLAQLRAEICRRHLSGKTTRTVSIQDPERDRRPACYEAEIRAWHERRLVEYERALTHSMAEGECGAFLVWGDPSLYDSTLRIFEQLNEKGAVAVEYEVIPGITSIQALTARHKICLNKIGQAVHITTGRNLERCPPSETDNVVVLLDGELALAGIDPQTTLIHWGAYLGTEHEILKSGRVADVIDELRALRREAREKQGWLMDTYLLSKFEQR
jgi:precorrin-6A synthase